MSSQEKISFVPAVLMTINVMIGVGIYFNPQLMASYAGNCSFLGWGVVAIILLPLIWVTALAARMFPGEGGFYNYGKTALNETVGFISIWSYLIGYVGMVSAQILALYNVVQSRFGHCFLVQNQLFFNVLFIIGLTLLSLLSITWISRIQSFATVLKLLPFFCVIGLLFVYWDPNFALGEISYPAIGSTFTFALFGYMGFESCTNISSFLKGGSQQAFKVILTAFFVTVVLYSFFHLGLLHIMGATGLVQSGVPGLPESLGLQSVAALMIAQLVLSIVLILTYANAIYGNMLSNVTNLASIAQKKMVFAGEELVKVNRFNRPILCVLIQCLAALLVITFFPNIVVVSAFANMAVVLTFIITALSVFITQLRQSRYVASLFSLLSLISCGIFALASWKDLGVSTASRLAYVGVLGVLLLIGIAMFKSLRCCSVKE